MTSKDQRACFEDSCSQCSNRKPDHKNQMAHRGTSSCLTTPSFIFISIGKRWHSRNLHLVVDGYTHLTLLATMAVFNCKIPCALSAQQRGKDVQGAPIVSPDACSVAENGEIRRGAPLTFLSSMKKDIAYHGTGRRRAFSVPRRQALLMSGSVSMCTFQG